jgi:tRNA A-37 threonylcarbamoyl transferase component Bud32/tetratricopeptide (TPR) repeat protein
MECLSDDAVVRFVAGDMAGDEIEAVHLHLDRCDQCRQLIADAATLHFSEPTIAPAVELAAGQTLARYTIARVIGRGATAVVYAAHDRDLDRPVALKILRPHAALGDQRERLLVEARAMARLPHANVIAIYDAGIADGQLFVSMELVDGVALREWLDEAPRSIAERLHHLELAGRALAAAHAAEICHGDFKPENVLVARDGGVRVGDFGLAQPLRADGAWGGTPAYMAPEQLRGGGASAKSDQYSFCVSLHEALIGRRPFDGASLEELAEAAGAGVPRSCPLSVPRRVWAAVRRGLSPDPADRFEDMPALLAALRGRRGWRRSALAAAAGGAVVATVGLAIAFGHAPAAFSSQRPTVAMLALHGASARPDAAWLEAAVRELVSADLASCGANVVANERAVGAERDLSLDQAPSLGSDELRRARSLLGVDYVIEGDYASEPGDASRVRLRLRVRDARSAANVGEADRIGMVADPFDLIAEPAAELCGRLGLPAPSASARRESRLVLPTKPGAIARYAEGIMRLRGFEPLGARDAFAEVVALEPEFALAHAALAEAWAALGYDDRATEEQRKAVALAAPLPLEQRRQLEARYDVMSHRWDDAVAIDRALFTLAPDRLDYGLDLVEAQNAGGHPSEALATIAALRGLPGPAAGDPAIDLAEAAAADALSDFALQRRAARAAADKGTVLGAPRLVARARRLEAWAVYRSGQNADELFAESERLFLQSGDRSGRAAALRAGQMARSERGDLVGSRAMLEEARSLYQQIGDQRSLGSVDNNLGNAMNALGDVARSRELHEEAFAIAQDIHDARLAAYETENLAELALEQGHLDDARTGAQAALASFRAQNEELRVGSATALLGRIEAAADHLDRARELLHDALAIQERGHHLRAERVTRIALAEIDLHDRRLEAAEATANEVADAAAADHDRPDHGFACILAASAQAARGELEPAQRSLACGDAQFPPGTEVEARLRLDLARARVELLAGQRAEAANALAGVAREAELRGWLPIAIEARVVAARLAPGTRDAVVRTARDAGLAWLARRARDRDD